MLLISWKGNHLNIVMSHHAVIIYICCWKSRTLSLLLVPSYRLIQNECRSLRAVWRVLSSGTFVQIAYILKANAGAFVNRPCLRVGFVFHGMHARANIWHCFDHFLHFMFFTWYENTIGNTNSVVIKFIACLGTRLGPSGAYKSTSKAAPILVRQAQVHGQRLRTACITSFWPKDTA